MYALMVPGKGLGASCNLPVTSVQVCEAVRRANGSSFVSSRFSRALSLWPELPTKMALSSAFRAQPPASITSRRVLRATFTCRASSVPQPQQPSRTVGRRLLLGAGLATALIALPDAQPAKAFLERGVPSPTRTGQVKHSEEEWLELLGQQSYNILRLEETERPWSSPLNDEKRDGTFVCRGCQAPLYNASAKYNSGTGWPSFYQAIPGAVDEVPDLSIPFMPRTEIRCHRCQGHLGHVFNDGPRPTGLRYCMNGLALEFVPKTA